ncbi:MAG: hypothetical protein GKC10_00435 [Methanosarcinales archaeon]|nr:hypothetical protein [Methanosarcinales archaeon]
MIIRIMGEGQYSVSENLVKELNAIDNSIVEHVNRCDEASYRRELANLIATVRSKGQKVKAEEIVSSDLIVPPEDLSLEEAKDIFCGQGIIED